MIKRLPIVSALLICSGLASAEFRTMEELEKAFPAAVVFDHSAELLAVDLADRPNVITGSVDAVEGMPFKQCLTLDVKDPGANVYAINIAFREENKWKVGDAGMIAFYCRTLETQNRYGASSFMLQYKPDYADWRYHVQADLFMTREWKLVMLPFEVTVDAADTPKSVLLFFLGGADPHKFQLSELHVFNYGKDRTRAELPQSEAYYPGIEADAPWRKAAKDRIEQHRKANLELVIKDAAGQPISGAEVHVKLKRHRFGFGAAITSPKLFDPKVPEERRRKYSDILTRTCSKITPSNGLKWKFYDSYKPHMDAMVEWAKVHDMTLRGHLFVWPGFERLPHGYDLYKTDPEAFRQDIIDHIHRFANLYPDAFAEWDVMNEPYTEHAFMDLLGKDVTVDWFKAAREANDGYLNYINDYGILSENNTEHQDVYYDWIEYLIEQGAPLDGIGFQGHYATPIPPEMILERIDRFAAFGKKMQITEFDIDHTDRKLQARFFEDFVTLIYSHPQMSAIINWMYLEDPFRPNAALYNKQFEPTAMGQVWERLLTRDWHTEETLQTDANGIVSLRGVKGIYEVTVTADETKTARTIDLSDDGRQDLVCP